MNIKNVKTDIAMELHNRFVPIKVNSLSRIISGEYRPRLGVAKELAAITGSSIDVWLNPDYTAERRLVIAKYAIKNGLDCHVRRGRPKINGRKR